MHSTPLSQDFANRFAQDWIAAWNSHDLDRVLAHYTDDFCMTSPFITQVMGEGNGTLRGKAEVRKYWQRALERFPDLKLTLKEIHVSVQSLAIYYESVLGLNAIEWFRIGETGQAEEAIAHFAGLSPRAVDVALDA